MYKPFVFLGAAVLFLAAALVSSPSSIIWWGRSKLVEKIPVGQTQEIELVFTSRKNFKDVNLSVSEDLGKFINTFEPATLEVVKDQPNRINVLINVPSDISPNTYGGTIHLRAGKRTIGKPLAVNIIVTPAEEPIPPTVPSWSLPVNISNSTITSYKPKVLQDRSGNVYALWLDSDFTSQYKLYFSKLEGEVWGSPQLVISSDKCSPLYDFDFTIDSQNQIHLTYTQTVSGSGYLVHYTFYNGTEWSNPQKVYQGFSPSIEVDSADKVHIVYSSFSDVFYSNFDGNIWSSPVNVSDDGQLYGDYTSGAKAIRIDKSGDIHVAWAKYNFGIMYTKFDSKTWSVPQLVSKLALWPDNTYWLSLGANGVVAVAYTQGPNDCINQEIYFSLSEDGGLSWYSPTQISGSLGIGSRWPSLAIVAANNIQAIWGECQIGVPFRLFNGISWSDIVDISNGTQKADLPNISANENKSYAVWGANNEIYFSQGQ
jgi:hypothetical protein